jgi:hypothetical protein
MEQIDAATAIMMVVAAAPAQPEGAPQTVWSNVWFLPREIEGAKADLWHGWRGVGSSPKHQPVRDSAFGEPQMKKRSSKPSGVCRRCHEH